MHNFFLPLLLILSQAAFSQIEEVRRITETLCSPEFHGRGYVNKGDSIASEFIAEEFRKIGVKPLNGKTYFQSFKHNVNTFSGDASLAYSEIKLVPGIHFLIDPSSPSYTGQLKAKKINVETALNDEKLALAIKGVLNSAEYNAIAFDFAGVSKDTLKLIAGKPSAFSQYLPVIEVTDQKFMWSIANSQTKFPLIQIQDSVYKWDKRIDIDLDAKLISGYESRNVMGIIPSKNKKAKVVVFTAHYDHLGRMGKDTYFPGANDNASGTAMLLSMAKYFKEHPVDYTVVFIAFAGEEAGLVGSKYFTEHPVIKLSKIRFLVNLDIMGSGEEGITVVNATLFRDEFKLLQEINEEKNLLAQVKERGPAANSDHYWFTQKGVPAIFIYTMGPNKNYHDVFDKYEDLSFNEYEDITTLLVEFVQRLK